MVLLWVSDAPPGGVTFSATGWMKSAVVLAFIVAALWCGTFQAAITTWGVFLSLHPSIASRRERPYPLGHVVQISSPGCHRCVAACSWRNVPGGHDATGGTSPRDGPGHSRRSTLLRSQEPF